MKAVDYIKTEMEMSKAWVLGLFSDIMDAPLTEPTPNGGNHPWWIIGHMVYSEANILNCYIRGGEHPFAEWKETFAIGSQPKADGEGYPPIEELLEKYESVRADTMAFIGSLTDEDLDKPSNAPEAAGPFFSTVGQCLAVMSMHLAFHGGQLADARRAAGRGILTA